MLKFRQKLINLLQNWLEKLNSSFNEKEYQERLAMVKMFFHEIMPSIDEKWSGKAIIEGGKFNYFQLPSGSLPKYDFVVPEIPLYVVVANISSSDWEQARQRGISRDIWEKEQLDLSFIQKTTSELATIGLAAAPKIIVIKWNDPINYLTLAEKLQEMTK